MAIKSMSHLFSTTVLLLGRASDAIYMPIIKASIVAHSDSAAAVPVLKQI